MPTYEYQCKTCGYKFEKFQHMSEGPLKVCPKCGREVIALASETTFGMFYDND